MKRELVVFGMVAFGAVVGSQPARASWQQVNSLDGRIQGGTLANTANLAATGSNPGYLEIKSGSSLSSTTRKSYLHFNLGPGLNTNANATFTLTFPFITPSSQSQRVRLWALNQEYAGGFDPATLTWNNAQANDTAENSALITNSLSPYNATLLATVVLPTADADHPNYLFTLAGGASANSWGQFVKNGTLTLALTGVPDSALNNNGPIRSPIGSSFIQFYTQEGPGPLPSISAVTNVSTYWTMLSPTNYFTVAGTSPGAPTAVSDNQNVVANGEIYIEPRGAGYVVYARGGTTAGTANIVITTTDTAGNPANANFRVTVNPVVPVVSNPPDTNTLSGVSVTIPFTTYQVLSNANSISIWATSLNTNVVADSGLLVQKTDAGGTNRTIKVTPLPGAEGIAPIALWASDGVNSNRTALAVQVRPSEKIALLDRFNYTTNLTSGGSQTLNNEGGQLYLASAAYWSIRGGSGASLLVTNQQALVRSGSGSTPQSLIVPLVGGPYLPNNDWVIYTSFKATWTSLPVDSGTFAHLYDPNASGTVGLIGRLSTVVTNTSTPPAAGFFHVGVANGEGTGGGNNYLDNSLDLAVGSTYLIVTKYVVDAAKTTLWITNSGQAISEIQPGTVAQDSHVARPVYSLGLRQGTDTGPVLIDDLKVLIVNKPLVTGISSGPAGYVNISFTGVPGDSTSDFIILSAAEVNGQFTQIPSGVTFTASGSGNFTAQVPMSGARAFYRVGRPPMVFP